MRTILWNLEQLDVTQQQFDKLLEAGMIYDPDTPEYPMYGIFYPEDNYTLDDLEEFLRFV